MLLKAHCIEKDKQTLWTQVKYLVKEHVPILLLKFSCGQADTGEVVIHTHHKTPHPLPQVEDFLQYSITHETLTDMLKLT